MTLRLTLLMALTLGCAQAIAQETETPITVTVSGAVAQPGSYTFEPGARLNNAAVTARVSSRAWFLGAALLRQSAMEQQLRLKAGLVFELGANKMYALDNDNTALADLVDRMHTAVSAMPVTGRVVAQLDPLQQLLIENNDLLEDGDQLRYPTRPNQVRVTGAVLQDCVIEHDPAIGLAGYLKQCERHSLADRNIAYVIQPNGTWQHYGIAYWNAQPANIATGAVIYLPVRNGGLSPTTSEFNRDMAAMLATQYRLGGLFGE